MTLTLRDFRPQEAEAINQLALAAFAQYRPAYADWQNFSANIGAMAALAQQGKLVVATVSEAIAWAVVYVGPHRPKAAIFDREWPILRMRASPCTPRRS